MNIKNTTEDAGIARQDGNESLEICFLFGQAQSLRPQHRIQRCEMVTLRYACASPSRGDLKYYIALVSPSKAGINFAGVALEKLCELQ